MTINNIFDQIKKVNEYGQEYWSARELMPVLEYARWENFETAISRSKISCKNSKQQISDHFRDVTKMISIAQGTTKQASRGVPDLELSRYACYLIAQNSDPKKEAVATAQSYFAIQTRRQEVNELQIEDNKRVYLRGEMKVHNSNLFKAAKKAGVFNYGNFQDYGYMGLYGGLRQKDIHNRKRLKRNEGILDHMNSEELAANLFRATQTEAKLKREGVYGQGKASQTHFDVGKKVRQTIKEIGGTMPEKLPTTENIKFSKKRLKE
jgi:DNA-damage-inducible protein D